jgi:ribosomal protein S18 acetylase RimI-like enzyme
VSGTNPPAFSLRAARPADLGLVHRIREAAFRETLERAGGWDDGEERRRLARRLREQEFRIVLRDGEDVGYLATDVAGDAVRLNQLMLLPECRGRGIGRACVEVVLEEARRRGRPVRLRVLKANPRALSFFLGCGFSRTGETATHDLLERLP